VANLAEGIRRTKSVETEVPLSAMSLAADETDAVQGLGIH
jgi:hypothetical protein